MNIKGLKHWEELKRYCDQTTNVIEKSRKDMGGRGYLETCGDESQYIGMDCMGDIDTYGNPTWMGIDCQPSDFTFCHLNWNKYDSEYQKGSAMDNRYLSSRQKMLGKMGYQTELIKEPKPSFFKKHLPQNHACIINIPGHYCCAIAWDFEKNEMIYHNPWPGDKRNKTNGRHERIKVTEWIDIPISQSLAFWR
jgi:hypothetical protein